MGVPCRGRLFLGMGRIRAVASIMRTSRVTGICPIRLIPETQCYIRTVMSRKGTRAGSRPTGRHLKENGGCTVHTPGIPAVRCWGCRPTSLHFSDLMSTTNG